MSSRPIRALGPSLTLLAAAAATPDPAFSRQLDLVLPAAPDTASPLEAASPGVQLENLRQAEEAHRRGDFARAKELWEAVVQANPNRPGAWLELAESRAMTGDMGGGLRALNRSLEMGPAERTRADGRGIALRLPLAVHPEGGRGEPRMGGILRSAAGEGIER